jgi:hypothetical protein
MYDGGRQGATSPTRGAPKRSLPSKPAPRSNYFEEDDDNNDDEEATIKKPLSPPSPEGPDRNCANCAAVEALNFGPTHLSCLQCGVTFCA